jgi:hypothetical protein
MDSPSKKFHFLNVQGLLPAPHCLPASASNLFSF